MAPLLTLAACVYVTDYLVLRVRMLHATPTSPFESMTRTRILAIAQKSGKTNYQIDQVQPVETLTCVHSLFPHYSHQPCWYLKPRLNQPIKID
jgi:hypothetical protein